MGVLTDIVVANFTDARRVVDSHCPSRDFGGLDAKGIDTVKLGTLYSILTSKPFDPAFMGKEAMRERRTETGPWVLQLPADLVQRLAELGPKKLRSVGTAWAKTEEFSPKYDNWPAEEVKRVLAELATLCRKAVAEDKVVLMWMCL